MTEEEYRDLLDWFMVSDPWPLSEDAHETIMALLDREAHSRDYDTWVAAYHDFEPMPMKAETQGPAV